MEENTNISHYSHILVNDVEVMLNEVITLRFDDGDKKFTLGIKATSAKKLINAGKSKPVRVIFIQLQDDGQFENIMDMSSSNAEVFIDNAGTMFIERLEMFFDEPVS